MRLAIFTNMPSHYQVALAKAFADRLGNDFFLVSWSDYSEERKQLGWNDAQAYDWLLRVGESEANRYKALELLRTAEVVIWGYAPHDEIKHRISNKRLTFHYTERLFKNGRWRLLDPRVVRGMLRLRQLDGPSHHLLAVGPYCAADYRLIQMYDERMWQWGYFPDLPFITTERTINDVVKIMWAGRFLNWKQVDLLLKAAQWVRGKSNVPFQIEIAGRGPEEKQLRALTNKLDLSKIVTFSPPQTPDEIIKRMLVSDIFVLPSSYSEGWGVVVNEAMSCGCCVIGSLKAGAVPWLIRDGENGVHFDGQSANDLGEKLLHCLSNPMHRQTMGAAARDTITTQWSPKVAADRFLNLCNMIETGKISINFVSGPCSKA